MLNEFVLPDWLDKFIFKELEAEYCRINSDMTVVDWNKADVKKYLGTYFPRSCAESFCLFQNYYVRHPINTNVIDVFDFGCGTGGEIVGLLLAIDQVCPICKTVNIKALDGNKFCLRLYEKVIKLVRKNISIEVISNPVQINIEDFYDLSILDNILLPKYDLFLSFKAICEFVTKDCFERKNAYEHIASIFLPKLKTEGILLIVDITTYNNVSQDWLPKMMDAGFNNLKCQVIGQNIGFNERFYVSHSRKQNDVSKIAWRIIK